MMKSFKTAALAASMVCAAFCAAGAKDSSAAAPAPSAAVIGQAEAAHLQQMTGDFFRALSTGDYQKAVSLFPSFLFSDEPAQWLEGFKSYGGLEIIKIGEPYKSGKYPGFYVPYEIRMKNGYVKKWQLAIRNDNPVKYYHVDGGF